MNAICCINELLPQFIDNLSNRNMFNQTDYITVNEKLAFRKGSLNILGSHTGKTNFSLSLIRELSINKNVPVGLFTCGENNKKQIVRRFISQEARINYSKITNGHLQQQEKQRINDCMETIYKCPFFLNDEVLSFNKLKEYIKTMVLEYNVQFIIVDDFYNLSDILDYAFFGECKTSYETNDNYRNAVAKLLNSIKNLAEKFNIPILLTMNISPSFGEPTMRCFKEISSLIKEKSDMIIFLYKEKDYIEESAAVDYYIIIEKNNSGRKERTRYIYEVPYLRYDFASMLEN